MSEADEVARLKAELASLQQETAALEKKPKKSKKKKEKKKRKSTEDDEAAKLRAELEAVDAETAKRTWMTTYGTLNERFQQAQRLGKETPAWHAELMAEMDDELLMVIDEMLNAPQHVAAGAWQLVKQDFKDAIRLEAAARVGMADEANERLAIRAEQQDESIRKSMGLMEQTSRAAAGQQVDPREL